MQDGFCPDMYCGCADAVPEIKAIRRKYIIGADPRRSPEWPTRGTGERFNYGRD